MNTTDYIALYGAFLSTLAIGWNIFNKIQDRPKIKVLVRFGFFPGDPSNKTFLFVNAVNKGTRTVSLNSFGLRSGEEIIINPVNRFSLPCELSGGKSHKEWFEVEKLKADKLKGRQFDYGWYTDETGKEYKSKSIKKMMNNFFKNEK